MKRFGIFIFYGLFAVLNGAKENSVSSDIPVPTFSPTYTVEGVIELPYAEIREPFTAYYDENQQLSRVDYYNGTVKTFQLATIYPGGASLKIVPVTDQQELNKITCFAVNGSDDSPVTIQNVFPNLDGFTYSNDELKDGEQCHKWTKTEIDFGKYNKFSFWASINYGTPVHYQMKGYDYIFGSHYDKYEIIYVSYNPSAPDSEIFRPNMTCIDFPGPGVSYSYLHSPIKELIDRDDSHVHTAFEEFKDNHNKTYSHHIEQMKRKSVFRQNLRYILSTNRKGLTYQLKVNHLTDRTNDERRYLRGKLYTPGYNGGKPFNKDLYTNVTAPDSFDWRLRGAVTPVKDQAICGSCWTFGTVATIEGAYFLKTGNLVKLSEQSLVDCAWGEQNNGCDGGEDWRAYQWIMRNGGIPSDESYGPYIGQDGFCRADQSNKLAEMTGYVNVTQGDIEALKIALVSHGPISVAIDASHKDLSFYSHGVYYNPKCNNTAEGLDHAVLAVGYGTQDGEDYWIIKNSWSTYWGNDGYVLMSRRNNNCGVATTPTYVTLK
ncbi:hypothetical protein CHUAL_003515 [Chamberlinius hualienensis]